VLVGNGYSADAALAATKEAESDPYLIGAVRMQQRMTKAVSVLNIHGKLTRLDSRSQFVERRPSLSRDEFRDQYYAANRPVLIEGLMTEWQAMKAWTPEYLKNVAGDCMAEVTTGRDADAKYQLNANSHRTEMRFADYVDIVYSGRVTNDYNMEPNNRFLQKPEARPLLQDFTAFPQYLRPVGKDEFCFLSFGPAGVVTPLHHATRNVLLAQVAGRKRYRLIPASQSQYVYNSVGVFSDVDCERPDYNRFPRFRNAMIIELVVQPGEVLFMPVGWWRHTRTLDVSMTISFADFVFPNHFRWER
jgi:ribosomal protein L16 Arg81 hydroxylase